MKAMGCTQTLTEIPKHFPKQITEAPSTVCYTE